MVIVLHSLPAFRSLCFQLSSRQLKLFQWWSSAFRGGIPCEKIPTNRNTSAMPIAPTTTIKGSDSISSRGGGGNHGIDYDCRPATPSPERRFRAQMPEHAEMDDHVHHQMKGPERGMMRLRSKTSGSRDHDGVDRRVVPDRAWHPEMAVRDHLHVRQHRQHPRTANTLAIRPRGKFATSASATVRVEAGLPEGLIGPLQPAQSFAAATMRSSGRLEPTANATSR